MRETINPTDGGPIVVYYSAYERQRLLELAVRYPEHLELLTSYIERLFDLHPVVKKSFYHPEMQGSFSIKKVLPVVAPDLNYDELVGVQEGTGAQIAYLFAALDPSVTKERKAEIEDSLRRYCRQDTWAMVELAYFLTRRGRPARPIEH
jgi:predicted RecB family nuclease